MIALLPISRYKVLYRTASGMPHSRLEVLILQSLAEGGNTLEALEVTFAIHPRLLIQSLVGLIQEGYVALGESRQYLLTEAGTAVALGDGTVRTRETPPRSSTVVVERLLGLIAPNQEIRFVGRQEIEELADTFRIKPLGLEARIDAAQVRHLLPRGPEEWIRSIEEVRLTSRGAHWLPVSVDHGKRRILGVPDRWQKLLTPTLLEATDVAVKSAPQDEAWFAARLKGIRPSQQTRRVNGNSFSVTVAPSDLFLGPEAGNLLSTVLKGTADAIVIASPTSSVSRLAELEAQTREALKRGAEVSLLVCGASEETSKYLERLRFALREEAFDGVATSSSGGLSILAWRRDGIWTCIVGAIAWLDSTGQGFGLRIIDRGAAATCLQAVSSAWSASSGGADSSTPNRLSVWAGALDQEVATHPQISSNGSDVRFLLGREAELSLPPGEPGPMAAFDDGCAVFGWRGGGQSAFVATVSGPAAPLFSAWVDDDEATVGGIDGEVDL